MKQEEEISDSELWERHKKLGKEKKRSNVESSLQILNQRGIPYQTLSAISHHYRIGEWDFWPSTGKFWNLKTGYKGRGIFNLLRVMRSQGDGIALMNQEDPTHE